MNLATALSDSANRHADQTGGADPTDSGENDSGTAARSPERHARRSGDLAIARDRSAVLDAEQHGPGSRNSQRSCGERTGRPVVNRRVV